MAVNEKQVFVSWIAVPTDFYPAKVDHNADAYTHPRLSISVTLRPENRGDENEIEPLPDVLKPWVSDVSALEFNVVFYRPDPDAGTAHEKRALRSTGKPVEVLKVIGRIDDVQWSTMERDNRLWQHLFKNLEQGSKPMAHKNRMKAITAATGPVRVKSFPAEHVSLSIKQLATTSQLAMMNRSLGPAFRTFADDVDGSGLGALDTKLRPLFWEKAEQEDPLEPSHNPSLAEALRRIEEVRDRETLAAIARANSKHRANVRASFGPAAVALETESDVAIAGNLMTRDLHRLSRIPHERIVEDVRRMTASISAEPELTALLAEKKPTGEIEAEKFLQAYLFHARVPKPKGAAEQSEQKVALTSAQEEAKFHRSWSQRIAMMRNYPSLQRRLGLILDLRLRHPGGRAVTAAEIDRAYGHGGREGISGIVAVEPRSDAMAAVPKLKLIRTMTRFRLETYVPQEGARSVTLFRPQDRRESDMALWVNKWRKVAPMPEEVEAEPLWLRRGTIDLSYKLSSGVNKFSLDTIDIDGSVMKLVNFARSYQKRFQTAARILTDCPRHGTAPIIREWNDRTYELLTARLRAGSGSADPALAAVLPSREPVDGPRLPLTRYFDKDDIDEVIGHFAGCRIKMIAARYGQTLRFAPLLQHPELGLVDHLVINIEPAGREGLRWILEPEREPAADDLELPPANRTVGLALYCAGRAEEAANNIRRSGALNKRAQEITLADADDAEPPICLDAADLMFGVVPEVRVSKYPEPPESGQWFSLCRRDEAYKFELDSGREVSWPEPAVDASIRLGITKSVDQAPGQMSAPSDLYASECLFSWSGWSLAVPNPFQNWRDQRGKAVEKEPITDLIKPNLTIPEDRKSRLPPMRFSRPVQYGSEWHPYEYCLRVSITDRTGYRRPHELLPEEDRTALAACVFRYEPISAPEILLSEPFTPDDSPRKSLTYMSIRDGKGSDQRILVPPRTSLDMCERHGALDGLSYNRFSDFNAVRLDEKGNFYVLQGHGDGPVLSSVEADRLLQQQRILREGNKPPTADGQPVNLTFYPIYRSGGFGCNCNAEHGYYPDPMARRMVARLVQVLPNPEEEGREAKAKVTNVDDGIDFGTAIDFYPGDAAWPNASAIPIELLPGEKDGLRWNAWREVLEVRIPHGQRYRLLLSCAADAREDSAYAWTVMALAFENCPHDDLRRKVQAARRSKIADAQTQSLLAASSMQRDGLDPLISPPVVVELVHAVSKPLYPVTLPELVIAERRPTSTFAAFAPIALQVHDPSTGELELKARWTDPVDLPEEPKYRDRQQNIVVATRDATVPRSFNLGHIKWEGVRHEFQDTKHRDVTYELTAVSRFRDEFPGGNHNDFTRVSAPVTIKIKSSAAPAPCDYLYSVPIFGWSRHTERYNPFKGPSYISKRAAGLRVWMGRNPGWWSSGAGEKLAVVLWPYGEDDAVPPAGVAAQVQNLVSRVGTDPTAERALVRHPFDLRPEHFDTGTHVENVLTREMYTDIDRTQQRLNVDIIAFKPRFDEVRGLWRCDIPLRGDLPYSGFVRLALARYQYDSIAGEELSPIVLADFMQVLPERWVSVSRAALSPRTMRVNIHGRKPKETFTGEFDVVVERHCGDVGKDAGWIPVAPGAEFEKVRIDLPPPAVNRDLVLEAYELRFKRSFIGPRRLVVCETETRNSGETDHEIPAQKRLVYVDVLELK